MKAKPILMDLDITHDCWCIDAAEKMGEGIISHAPYMASNDTKTSVVELKISSPEVGTAISAIESHPYVKKVVEVYRDKSKGFVYVYCDYGKIVLKRIHESGCIRLDPSSTTDGVDKVLVMAPAQENVRQFFDLVEDDCTVNIHSKKQLKEKEMGSFDFFENSGFLKLKTTSDFLTPRQRETFETACAHGYYKYPKKVTLGDIAELQGISASTAAEHLRKAEKKLFPVLLEALQVL